MFLHVLEECWSRDVVNRNAEVEKGKKWEFEQHHIHSLKTLTPIIGYQYVNQVEGDVGIMHYTDFDIVDMNNEYKGTIRFAKNEETRKSQKTFYQRTFPTSGIGSIKDYQYLIHNIPLANGDKKEQDYSKQHFEQNPPK